LFEMEPRKSGPKGALSGDPKPTIIGKGGGDLKIQERKIIQGPWTKGHDHAKKTPKGSGEEGENGKRGRRIDKKGWAGGKRNGGNA